MLHRDDTLLKYLLKLYLPILTLGRFLIIPYKSWYIQFFYLTFGLLHWWRFSRTDERHE